MRSGDVLDNSIYLNNTLILSSSWIWVPLGASLGLLEGAEIFCRGPVTTYVRGAFKSYMYLAM